MSSEQPPPYAPPPPSGFSSPPGTFPGTPYQAYPAQTFTGGDSSYYQGPVGPSGPYTTQPGYQDFYHGGPHGAAFNWESPKPYREPPKHTVYVVDQNRAHGRGGSGGAMDSCLSACSAALCCCCLWDLLTHKLG